MAQNDTWPELDPDASFKTREEIATYLILKHYNGMSFKHMLDLHIQILARIGRNYAETWGPVGDNADADVHRMYNDFKDGAYYVLEHLEDSEFEWNREGLH